MRIGIVGTGKICDIYLKNIKERFTSNEVTAVADLLEDRAKAKADEYGVPHALPVDDLITSGEVDAVLNLTIPAAHAEVCEKALQAGKHCFTEKPLATGFADGKRLLELAREKGVLLGSAPDTFLGGGLQTVRALVDNGAIGTPVGVTAFLMGRGPENWHPNPHFFYQPGAGPLFDVGPYYITAMVTLLGPVKRLSAAARISFPERHITEGARAGETIPVTTPTYVAGTLEFVSGVVGTLITTFDVYKSRVPRIEIYGSEGSLNVPDPNTFGGPVELYQAGAKDWTDVPIEHGYTENSRGIGLTDLTFAASNGREPRAGGELALHCLEIMHGLLSSGDSGSFYEMTTSCERPAPLSAGLSDGSVD